jgi:hypothetical protein
MFRQHGARTFLNVPSHSPRTPREITSQIDGSNQHKQNDAYREKFRNSIVQLALPISTDASLLLLLLPPLPPKFDNEPSTLDADDEPPK